MNSEERDAFLEKLVSNLITISFIQLRNGKWGGLLALNDQILFSVEPEKDNEADVMAEIDEYILINRLSEKLTRRGSHGV